ncbi:hypothetical protein AD998_13270 [bacterium 336/3]|nr:hypothetical protein AD998_13270 [bacterium 336/3]
MVCDLKAQTFFTLGNTSWNNNTNWSNDGSSPCSCNPLGIGSANIIIRTGHTATITNASHLGTNNNIDIQSGGILRLSATPANTIATLQSTTGGGTLDVGLNLPIVTTNSFTTNNTNTIIFGGGIMPSSKFTGFHNVAGLCTLPKINVTSPFTCNDLGINLDILGDVTLNGGNFIFIGTTPHTIRLRGNANITGGTFGINNNVTFNQDPTSIIINDLSFDVQPGGVANFGGTFRQLQGANISGSGAKNFVANSVYIHDGSGGVIPTANWSPTSECRIVGVTNTALTTTSFAQTFGNFTWDCPLQTTPQTINANMTVLGDFKVLNTSTESLTLATSGNFTLTTNNLILNPTVGNTAQFFLANGGNTGTIDLKGNLNDGIIPSGTITFGLVGTSGGAIANISFTGTNNQFFNPPPFSFGSQSNYQYNITINKLGVNNKVILVPLNYNFVPTGILSNTIDVINGVFSISRNFPNNQTIDIDNIQGAGTLEMTNASHILNIYGNNSTITNLVTDGSDTQIYYLGAGNQNVFPSPNYRTVGFRGNVGIKTLLGNIIVNKNLLIDTGVNFDVSASNFVVALRGDWINKGAFTPRNGRVEFIGANSQIIGDVVSTTFYDLEINNTANVTIANGVTNSVTVTNNLNLTNGKLILNNDLNATGNITSTINNYIVTQTGKLNRLVSTPDISYPIGSISQYVPVTLSGGDGSSVGMAFDGSPIPSLPVGATDVAFGSWFMESPTNTVRIRFDNSGSTNSFSKIHKLNGAVWLAEATTFNASPSATYTTTTSQSSGNFAYTIFNPPTGGTITISPLNLPNAIVGVPYNINLTATGGSGMYTFTVTSGTLPNGLTLSLSGILSGIPLEATAGRTIDITASDGTITGLKNYNFVIDKGEQSIQTYSSTLLPDGKYQLTAVFDTGLPVSFLSTNREVATIQGNIVSLTSKEFNGEADILVFQEGNNNFKASDSVVVLRINSFGLTTGFNELEKNIKLYPNPTTQKDITIVTSNPQLQIMDVLIISALGIKMPISMDINGNIIKINTELLPEGTYSISIKTNQGNAMKKLIKL